MVLPFHYLHSFIPSLKVWVPVTYQTLCQVLCSFLDGQDMGLSLREGTFMSLGQEDALENEMATHSSILAWRIPWTEEPGMP